MEINKIENLVLSGGGLLGISYIGIFKYLEEKNAAKQIKMLVGSSAGALFGLLFILGYTHVEIYDKIKDMKFNEYVSITAESILNFMRVKGVNSCEKIMQFIKDVLLDKTGNSNITFKELYEKSGIVFRIGATNLTASRFELFDHITMPDLQIYIAIKASIAIPFVFEPVIINEHLYCDGGLCDNFPIDYVIETISNSQQSEITVADAVDNIDINKLKLKTLGIYLSNTHECINPKNYLDASIYQYLNSILHTVFLHPTLEKKNKENIKNYKIIIIEIPCDIMTFLKLYATCNDINNIIDIAYNTISSEYANN